MTNAIKEIFGETSAHSRMDYVALSRSGIPMTTFQKILEFTSLQQKEMAALLPISERQIARYDDNHTLKKEVSSHLIQLTELFDRGYEVFGEEKFQIWIRTKNRTLGNVTPLTLLDTSIGIQIVTDLIGRIEHGVYS
ncbi:MAG: antitoxin Xre/MbcA/ParS toxin-binding domain-containing protein [Bacteroidota bacterium]